MLKFESLTKINKGKEWRVTYLLGQCEWDVSSYGKYAVATSYQSRFLVLVILKALLLEGFGSREYECQEGSTKCQQ